MTKNTIYIYSTKTGDQVDSHSAADNAACEKWATENYGDTDAFGWTYSPGGNPDIKRQVAEEAA